MDFKLPITANPRRLLFMAAGVLFFSCNEPKPASRLPLELLKQKATSPCHNIGALAHSDSMFVQEFKAQDLRAIALCVSCDRSLNAGRKIEIYQKFLKDLDIPVSRMPDWSKFK